MENQKSIELQEQQSQIHYEQNIGEIDNQIKQEENYALLEGESILNKQTHSDSSLVLDKNKNKLFLLKKYQDVRDFKQEIKYLQIITADEQNITPTIEDYFQDSKILMQEIGAFTLQQYSDNLYQISRSFQWSEEQLIYLVYSLINHCDQLYQNYQIFHGDIRPEHIVLDAMDEDLYQFKLINFERSCANPKQYASFFINQNGDPEILINKLNIDEYLTPEQCIRGELYSIGMVILNLLRYGQLSDSNNPLASYEDIIKLQEQFFEDENIQEKYPHLLPIMSELLRKQNIQRVISFEQALEIVKQYCIYLNPEIPEQYGFIDQQNSQRSFLKKIKKKIENYQKNQLKYLQTQLQFNIDIKEYPECEVIVNKIDQVLKLQNSDEYKQQFQDKIKEEQENFDQQQYVFNKLTTLFETCQYKKCFEFLTQQQHVEVSDPEYHNIVYWIGECVLKNKILKEECEIYLLSIEQELQDLNQSLGNPSFIQKTQLEISILRAKMLAYDDPNLAIEMFQNIRNQFFESKIYTGYYELRHKNHIGKCSQIKGKFNKKFFQQGLDIINSYKNKYHLQYIFPIDLDQLYARQQILLVQNLRHELLYGIDHYDQNPQTNKRILFAKQVMEEVINILKQYGKNNNQLIQSIQIKTNLENKDDILLKCNEYQYYEDNYYQHKQYQDADLNQQQNNDNNHDDFLNHNKNDDIKQNEDENNNQQRLGFSDYFLNGENIQKIDEEQKQEQDFKQQDGYQQIENQQEGQQEQQNEEEKVEDIKNNNNQIQQKNKYIILKRKEQDFWGSGCLCYEESSSNFRYVKIFKHYKLFRKELNLLQNLYEQNLQVYGIKLAPNICEYNIEKQRIYTERGSFTLEDYLQVNKSKKKLNEKQLLQILYNLIQVSNQLYQNHNIFHGNIKPSNIILEQLEYTDMYKVYYQDYGASCKKTHNYGFINTPEYFDPAIQQWQQTNNPDQQMPTCLCVQAELYAMGMTILQSITEIDHSKQFTDECGVFNSQKLQKFLNDFTQDVALQQEFPFLIRMLKVCLRFKDFQNIKIKDFQQAIQVFKTITSPIYLDLQDFNQFEDMYNQGKSINIQLQKNYENLLQKQI